MKHTNRIGRLCAAALLALSLSVSPLVGQASAQTNPALAYASYAQQAASSKEERPLSQAALTAAAQTGVDDDTTPSDGGTPAEGISISGFPAQMNVGETYTLSYALTPADSDDTVAFTSSDISVAEVDDSGNVTAMAPGVVTINAVASSGVRDTATISVAGSSSPASGKGATDIELRHNIITLNKGETYQITYDLKPVGVTDTVNYRSVLKTVATVTSDGLVTAVSEGSTRIVCTAGSGVYVKLAVNVIDIEQETKENEQADREAEVIYNSRGQMVPSRVRFADESESLSVGESKVLDARIYPAGATYTYTITSSDPSVCTVTRGGKVTGVSPGNATITLSTDNGLSDSIFITVYSSVLKGIDVSKWNGDINWKKVKASGKADFVMIRASYGSEDTDPKLDANVSGAESVGIPYGFYHYTYARTTAQAKQEAKYFLNAIKGYDPTYPIVLDIEEEFYKSMDRETVTDIVKTFMNAFEKAGYYAMIYSYSRFFDSCVYMDELTDYDVWVACWGDKEKLAESYGYYYGMWQYSETGKIAGIEEYVDLNYAYKDYRGIIIKYGLNHTA
ncbi:MAG: Ig-like domain-containing protein [Oscillospiraceae bacterium]|nr:Ig-like domain-containing protein [Oscillospiraceae bacterium]